MCVCVCATTVSLGTKGALPLSRTDEQHTSVLVLEFFPSDRRGYLCVGFRMCILYVSCVCGFPEIDTLPFFQHNLGNIQCVCVSCVKVTSQCVCVCECVLRTH